LIERDQECAKRSVGSERIPVLLTDADAGGREMRHAREQVVADTWCVGFIAIIVLLAPI
jgi:hypothetical protein